MNGRDGWLGMKEMWIGYNVGHRMGSLLCYSARQTDWPSDGSMWNSFQPVGPWMGHSFTKLGLGCWRSLNAVRMFITNRLRFNKGLKIPKGQSYPIISAIFYKIIQINQKEIGFEERNHIKIDQDCLLKMFVLPNQTIFLFVQFAFISHSTSWK